MMNDIQKIDNPRNQNDKRQDARYRLSVPVIADFIKKDSFSSLRFSGHCHNITTDGIMIQLEGLSEDQYKGLTRGPKMVRVRLNIPNISGETVFLGRIVWHRRKGVGAGASSQFGIGFTELREKEQKTLTKLLEQLRSSK